MARKQYVRKSDEDKQAEVQAAHERIAKAVAEVRDGEDWKKFLAFGAKFHAYSFNNTMLIYLQCQDRGMEEPTHVASFRKWNEDFKNPVAKGAKGLKIFAPVIVKIKPGEKGYVEGENRTKCVGFRLVTVFDVQQTVDPTAVPKNPAREMYAAIPTGDVPEGVDEALTGMIEAEGYGFRYGDTGKAGGYASPTSKEVVISTEKEPGSATAIRTKIHELAHVLLHCEDEDFDYMAHRGVAEIEAEGTAFVVGSYFGIDMSTTSAGYIAGWAGGDTERVVKAGKRIMATAKKIIDGVEASILHDVQHALAA